MPTDREPTLIARSGAVFDDVTLDATGRGAQAEALGRAVQSSVVAFAPALTASTFRLVSLPRIEAFVPW